MTKLPRCEHRDVLHNKYSRTSIATVRSSSAAQQPCSLPSLAVPDASQSRTPSNPLGASSSVRIAALPRLRSRRPADWAAVMALAHLRTHISAAVE
jgi:hypothetical protein